MVATTGGYAVPEGGAGAFAQALIGCLGARGGRLRLRHTLWAYTHVPSIVDGGWAAQAEKFGDSIDARIEELAPGFRSTIMARRVVSPDQLQVMCSEISPELLAKCDF